jgi:transposase
MLQSCGDTQCTGPAGSALQKKSLHASEQLRSDVVAQREAWRAETWDLAHLVFVDETGAKTNMTRLYGRAPGGHRVVDAAPNGHWATTTLLASIRLDGATAPMVIEGATDTEVFTAYVQQVLVPTLGPDDTVILDNLSPHKSRPVEAAIRRVGARLRFLPPHSPDLNPIEPMWSKVKTFLRALKARIQENLLVGIGQALKTVTPTDAVAWFAHCGYVATQN